MSAVARLGCNRGIGCLRMEPSFIPEGIKAAPKDTKLRDKLEPHLHKGQSSSPLTSMKQKTGQIALARFLFGIISNSTRADQCFSLSPPPRAG